MKKNCMVHCSFDLVDHFEPRVPKNRIEGKKSEDGTIARICVASDIRNSRGRANGAIDAADGNADNHPCILSVFR